MASSGVSPMRQSARISGKLNQIGVGGIEQQYTTIEEGGNEASEDDEQEVEEEDQEGQYSEE